MSADGRVALITGAGRGIGKALALGFGREGYRVVVASTTAERNEAVADLIREAGGKALAVTLDVADEASVKQAVAKTLDDFGRVDVLINNAGLKPGFIPTEQKSLKDLDVAIWRRMFEVNGTGPFLCARECIPPMIALGGGAIINVSSGAGDRPREGQSMYGISKAALNMLTGVLALELKTNAISVNGISPGYTVEVAPTNRPLGAATPLKTESCVPLCLFLAAQDPIEVTGENLNVLHWNEAHGLGGQEVWSIFA